MDAKITIEYFYECEQWRKEVFGFPSSHTQLEPYENVGRLIEPAPIKTSVIYW